MKKLAMFGLVFAMSIATVTLMTGCGGGSDSDDDPAPTTNNDDGGSTTDDGGSTTDDGGNGTVSGNASAPGGAVALFEQKSALQVAMDFLIPPAAAAITGLEPVTGATVELIRIGNDGLQVGDVLATTTTSITGDYTLTLPAGVDLAGNLIVRITGIGVTKMRAQVVERELDITPVSEFVLQRFINNGADLENLTTASVVKLSGQVEEFDLTVSPGTNLETMLGQLEEETGAFVDNQIDVITTPAGDVSSVAGDYRASFIGLGLHDDDGQHGVGTFSVNLENLENITLADGGSGVINITASGTDQAWANLTEINSGFLLTHNAEIDTEEETFSALLGEDGVINIEEPFEEEIDGEFAWREPPSISRFQKAKTANIFISLSESANVRYKTTEAGALDPEQREGDEVFRDLEFVFKKPSEATEENVKGTFGRVYLGLLQNVSGHIEIETERNILTFNGTNTLAMSAPVYRRLESTPPDATVYFSEDGEGEEESITFALTPDGDIPTVGEGVDAEEVDGFINDDFDFLIFNESSSTDDDNTEDDQYQEVRFGTTIAVKLPEALVDLTGRTYRVLFLTAEFDGSAMAFYNTRSDTTLTITGTGESITGVVSGTISSVSKATRDAEVAASTEVISEQAVNISLDATGAMSLTTFDESQDATQMDGYLNHDGSLGIFNVTHAPADSLVPTELGVMILMEI